MRLNPNPTLVLTRRQAPLEKKLTMEQFEFSECPTVK